MNLPSGGPGDPVPPPDRPSFIADVNVGKLARWLRVLGYDTLFINPIDDGLLVDIALREGRIVLTRDTHIPERRLVTRGRTRRGQRMWRRTTPRRDIRLSIDYSLWDDLRRAVISLPVLRPLINLHDGRRPRYLFLHPSSISHNAEPLVLSAAQRPSSTGAFILAMTEFNE